MKYNENAFDRIMEDYELDNLVTEKVVRSDAVKDGVFSQLGLGVKNKKKFNKKIFGFIAAAAALAVIGTSVIAVNPFKDAFKGYIGITDDVPVYAGDNVQISSDKANVELKGVVCDDTMLFATFEITKKDGTPFINDISDSYIQSFDQNYRNSRWEAFANSGKKDAGLLIDDDQKVFFTELAPNENDTQENYIEKMRWMGGRISYDFKDNKTIKGFLEYNNSNKYDFQGKTLGLSEGKIYIYTRGERIYNYQEMNNNAKYNFKIYKSQTDKIVEKYTPLLKENQIIDWVTENNSLYITTITEVDVDYKISFDVNYKPQNLFIKMDNTKEFDIAEGKITFDSIEITPFRAILKGISSGGLNWDQIGGSTLDTKNNMFYRYGGLDIVLKDGTIIKTGLGMSVNNDRIDGQPDLTGLNISYNKFCDDNFNFTAIDPANVKAVYLVGVKIYGDGSDTIPLVTRKKSEGWWR